LYPDKEILILADSIINAKRLSAQHIICGQDSPDTLDAFDIKKTIFLYACDSDEIGLPYVKNIYRRKGRFYPTQSYTPSSYANINETARRILESEYLRQSAEGFQKFDFGPGDFLNIIQAIDITSSRPGDYVEIGCFRGSSSCVAVRYMNEKKLQRNCYFLDVFTGFSYDAAKQSSDMMWNDSHATEGIETVTQRISKFGNPDAGLKVHVVKCNVVEQALPSEIEKVVVANIDVDMLEAVTSSLFKIAPKVVLGGIIIVEDPGHTPALIGSRLALQEFLASPVANLFIPIYMESGQTFLLKVS
jgi:hypothetical protein